MKSYILSIIREGGEITRITLDTDSFNTAYYVMSSVCERLVFGFGDAKANLLYTMMEPCEPFTWHLKSDGKMIQIKFEVV